jgi:transcriptional regulator with XRE-family HTH domain
MIAEQLRVAIQEGLWRSGVGQAELARRCGMSEAMISRFLRGQRFPSAGAVDRLLDVLGLEVEVRARRERKGD